MLVGRRRVGGVRVSVLGSLGDPVPRAAFLDGDPPRDPLRLEDPFVGDSGGLGKDPRGILERGVVQRVSRGGPAFRGSREGRRSVPGGE